MDEEIGKREDIVRKEAEALIKLKRTRNSLLNVNRLPPEVLGGIFQWNVMFEGGFGGLEKRSHNFMLVCHYWSGVALRTQGIWSFWGNTTNDWARFYCRSATAPLDLVLNSNLRDEYFDETLTDVLQDRASRDTIRHVHLKSSNIVLLNSVLSPLTHNGVGIRSNRMESFILSNWDLDSPVDVSDFFAHYLFPRLKRLELSYCSISSWDHLVLRTGSLTHLRLGFEYPSPNPTTSQLLSLLASNPLLQRITLPRGTVPNDNDELSHLRIPLHHLRYLNLAGDLQHVLRLLDRLDFPVVLDEFEITLDGCTDKEISGKIGQYLRNLLQQRGESQIGLSLDTFKQNRIALHVGNVVGMDQKSVHMDQVLDLTINLIPALSYVALRGITLELIAQFPWGEFVYFEGPNKIVRTLHPTGIDPPTVSPQHSSCRDEDTFLYIQNLTLGWLSMHDDSWSPLTPADPSSSVGRLKILNTSFSGHMCSEVVDKIKEVVPSFNATRGLNPSEECPFGAC